jgi:hypothetical protein
MAVGDFCQDFYCEEVYARKMSEYWHLQKKYIIVINTGYPQVDRKEKIEEDTRRTKRCVTGMMIMKS